VKEKIIWKCWLKQGCFMLVQVCRCGYSLCEDLCGFHLDFLMVFSFFVFRFSFCCSCTCEKLSQDMCLEKIILLSLSPFFNQKNLRPIITHFFPTRMFKNQFRKPKNSALQSNTIALHTDHLRKYSWGLVP
jgi:hypothetical protein